MPTTPRRRLLLVPLAAALAAASLHLERPVAAQQAGSAQAVAQRLQDRYNRLRDFQADFVQTTKGGLGGLAPAREASRGRLYVKRPGRMRWDYNSPEKYQLLWDGTRTYVYHPDVNQASVTETSPDDTGSIGVMFLSGKGDLLRDFVPSLAPITKAGTLALKLTPKKDASGESFVVVVDEQSSRLRLFTTNDGRGSETTTEFANLKEDSGMSEDVFKFNPKKGTVITGPAGTR